MLYWGSNIQTGKMKNYQMQIPRLVGRPYMILNIRRNATCFHTVNFWFRSLRFVIRLQWMEHTNEDSPIRSRETLHDFQHTCKFHEFSYHWFFVLLHMIRDWFICTCFSYCSFPAVFYTVLLQADQYERPTWLLTYVKNLHDFYTAGFVLFQPHHCWFPPIYP